MTLPKYLTSHSEVDWDAVHDYVYEGDDDNE
ncbi:hypothetical protein SEA_HEATHEN_57 [Mycobacterium phage Heathen]|uniref:Uncharacterized protein n=3 Tax=Veracruzvirus heldan TaxID=1032892 RepID=A0A8F3II98_9CAUD|nr:hypothetical protein FGG19_gp40 [Mycobacterium phage HelDan]AEJ92058.1 hypothetical protein HELDAN_57 [Mycobacterium phage HelDan]QDP44337.1 hypothetical protein SEA_HEATHEN_57 [Mycobacterium phage Heathen]QWY79598.1 hypothetical protein SEA_SCOUT_57 [Mycobacterium phage Scout]